MADRKNHFKSYLQVSFHGWEKYYSIYWSCHLNIYPWTVEVHITCVVFHQQIDWSRSWLIFSNWLNLTVSLSSNSDISVYLDGATNNSNAFSFVVNIWNVTFKFGCHVNVILPLTLPMHVFDQFCHEMHSCSSLYRLFNEIIQLILNLFPGYNVWLTSGYIDLVFVSL